MVLDADGAMDAVGAAEADGTVVITIEGINDDIGDFTMKV